MNVNIVTKRIRSYGTMFSTAYYIQWKSGESTKPKRKTREYLGKNETSFLMRSFFFRKKGKQRLVFCETCGECLGKYRPNFAKSHLRTFPSHRSFLTKAIIDPLTLSDFGLSQRLSCSNGFITRFRTAKSSPEGWTEPKNRQLRFWRLFQST